MSQFLSSAAKLLVDNGLITSFVIVGLIVFLSNVISVKAVL